MRPLEQAGKEVFGLVASAGGDRADFHERIRQQPLHLRKSHGLYLVKYRAPGRLAELHFRRPARAAKPREDVGRLKTVKRVETYVFQCLGYLRRMSVWQLARRGAARDPYVAVYVTGYSSASVHCT